MPFPTIRVVLPADSVVYGIYSKLGLASMLVEYDGARYSVDLTVASQDAESAARPVDIIIEREEADMPVYRAVILPC